MTPVEIQIRNAVGALAWNSREWRRFRHATGARLAEIARLSHTLRSQRMRCRIRVSSRDGKWNPDRAPSSGLFRLDV